MHVASNSRRGFAPWGLLMGLWMWAACQTPNTPPDMGALNSPLATLASELMADTTSIDQARQSELNELARWTAKSLAERGSADLVFICTHNSRRSHLSQVWAQVGAAMHGLVGVHTFSGGTEATACNPRTVAAMQRAGFGVSVADTQHGEGNPTYRVKAGDGVEPMMCWSKKYGDSANPADGFLAVMTCSSADQSCPLVHGASARFAVPYVDPKVSDGSAEEGATYDERLRQIGTEMLYMMGQVAGEVSP